MESIRKLKNADANTISAGQQVLSPIHCIKELIENSLDADSKSITIQVDFKTCGLSYISVSDTGKGIPKEERHLVGLPNHTSKINTYEDLSSDNFSTLGFRGEALFMLKQITSCGTMIICSKTQNDIFGEEWQINNQTETRIITNHRVVTCNVGTKVTLLKAFFHLPVRYRFSINEAARNIEKLKEMVLSFCLCWKDVRFNLKFVEYSDNLKRCVSHKPNKDQVYLYKTDITGVLVNLFPRFRSLPGCYASAAFTTMEGLDFTVTIDFSFLLETEDMGIPKGKHFMSVCINKILLTSHGLQSFHQKLKHAVSNSFAEFDLPSSRIYYISIEGVPNRYIDGNIEPDKTKIFFTDSEIEQALMHIIITRLKSRLGSKVKEYKEAVEEYESFSSTNEKALDAVLSTKTDTSIMAGYNERTVSLSNEESESKDVSQSKERERGSPTRHLILNNFGLTIEADAQNTKPPIIGIATKESEDNWSFAMHDPIAESDVLEPNLSPSRSNTSYDEDIKVSNRVTLSNPFTIAKMSGSRTKLGNKPMSHAVAYGLDVSDSFRASLPKFIDSSTPMKWRKQGFETNSSRSKLHIIPQVKNLPKEHARSTSMTNQAIKEPSQSTLDQLVKSDRHHKTRDHLCNAVQIVESGGFNSLKFDSDQLESYLKWVSRRGVPSEIIRNTYLAKVQSLFGKKSVVWKLQEDDVFVGTLQP